MGWFRCCRKKEFASRTVWLGGGGGSTSGGGVPTSAATTAAASAKFPPNVIRNQKYSVVTFLPLVLYNQFKFFLNLFFLIMAVSQFIPQLRDALFSAVVTVMKFTSKVQNFNPQS